MQPPPKKLHFSRVMGHVFPGKNVVWGLEFVRQELSETLASGCPEARLPINILGLPHKSM